MWWLDLPSFPPPPLIACTAIKKTKTKKSKPFIIHRLLKELDAPKNDRVLITISLNCYSIREQQQQHQNTIVIENKYSLLILTHRIVTILSVIVNLAVLCTFLCFNPVLRWCCHWNHNVFPSLSLCCAWYIVVFIFSSLSLSRLLPMLFTPVTIQYQPPTWKSIF